MAWPPCLLWLNTSKVSPALSNNVSMVIVTHTLIGKSYWAKDIIFLVTSGGEIGTQAWIDSYMGGHTEGKRRKKRAERGGENV